MIGRLVLTTLAALHLLVAAGPAWTAGPAGEAPPLRPLPHPLPGPELELTDMTGAVFRLDEHLGQVVLVNFWATWCPPCRKEMPALQRLSQRLGDERFQVLGVNVGEDPERIAEFLQTLPEYPDFPILLDRDGEVARSWNVPVVPTTWVIDRDARKVLRSVGVVDYDDPALVEQLQHLITDPAFAEQGTGDWDDARMAR